jgi:hypothetical protein
MLTVEILDPEDGVAARIDRRAFANPGRSLWRQEVVLPKALPFEDLVWHRLRYQFTYKGEQTASQQGLTSISRILRLPAVHVFGQQSYLSGGAAAVRLIVTEQDKETPVSSGAVVIQLVGSRTDGSSPLYGKIKRARHHPGTFSFPDRFGRKLLAAIRARYRYWAGGVYPADST